MNTKKTSLNDLSIIKVTVSLFDCEKSIKELFIQILMIPIIRIKINR